MNIKIGDMTYKIVLVSEFDEALKGKANTYHFGMCKYTTNTIYIANELCYERKLATLIHELVHAYIDSNGLYDANKKMDEEGICEFIAHIYKSLNENVEKLKKFIK